LFITIFKGTASVINHAPEILFEIDNVPAHSVEELITNHAARKTFITNSIVLGMNTKTIWDMP